MNQAVADLLLQKYGKKNPADINSGDTVRIHQRIVEVSDKGERRERVQIFEGLVIATKHGSGLNGSFTVRKIAVGGIGVERTYPVHSPNIIKIERTKTAEVHRAKLYYMRDRLGKAARFKNESRNIMSWDEAGAPVLEEVEIPTEELVQVQPEGSVEAETIEQLKVEESVPTESQEVIAGIETETEK